MGLCQCFSALTLKPYKAFSFTSPCFCCSERMRGESDCSVLKCVIWELVCVCSSGGGGWLSGLQLVMPSCALRRKLFPPYRSCVWDFRSSVWWWNRLRLEILSFGCIFLETRFLGTELLFLSCLQLCSQGVWCMINTFQMEEHSGNGFGDLIWFDFKITFADNNVLHLGHQLFLYFN